MSLSRLSTQNILLAADDSFTFLNPIRFPYGPIQGPFMGIFLALSLPLELPDYNVFFSYNLEANYELPQNETDFTYPPLVSRSWGRKYFYDILEFKMKSHGYPGKNCLLRAICETSLYSSENTGILGDMLHVLLTPSSSTDNVLSDYGKAELYGKSRKNCRKYTKKCSISFLDLVSQVGHYIVDNN
ncbi:hypothetical protein TcasGA2_TC004760 [Tribolium castaneum]|uniref:Uncharacterized protein n=1 Tax=Tribolium castaneum TaxID=7070 RepID=D6W7Y6_TRICA|nr:hypothetical protein TcasGA2_TC004760 [Tribolium castaneum]